MPSRSFDKGFPGVTDRFEWFAIDYTGKMLISRPAKYRFRITSDDGSRVYIDDKLLIDNDGVHPARTAEGGIDLAPGLHRIRVSYFQGPRYEVALVLEVAAGSEPYRPFRAKAFAPVEMSESHGQLKIELPEAILFDFDQYDLKPAAVSVLAEVEESVLSKRPASKLLVGGYTDDVGADSYNLDLSRRRAESVAGWLRQHGIAAERLQVEGYGSQSPKVPNTSAGNRARNRRVEIFVR
ncbi:MAG TPA: OmpA family protein [Candidatus Acidoferrales bacterium]|nr:OmpA family protein [Candidatus Acidoferrales bacterium]